MFFMIILLRSVDGQVGSTSLAQGRASLFSFVGSPGMFDMPTVCNYLEKPGSTPGLNTWTTGDVCGLFQTERRCVMKKFITIDTNN